MHTGFILGFLGITAALPQGGGAPPPANEEFGLTMRVESGTGTSWLSLNAVRNGTDKHLSLIGESYSDFPGTLAFLNGTNLDAMALNMIVNGCPYGLSTADLGDLHGIAATVTATEGLQQFEFKAWHGIISHKLSSAANSWMACNLLVNNELKPVLAWGAGNPTPAGCSYTEVRQHCVPGSSVMCK